MVQAKCPVCLFCFNFDKFRFLSCGHACCVSCSKRISNPSQSSSSASSRRPACHICRKPITTSQGFHSLYALQFVETTKDKIDYVTERLDQIDESAKQISVSNAAKHLRRAAKDIVKYTESQAEQTSLRNKLLQAIERLESRLEPAFAEFKLKEERISYLEAQLKNSEEARLSALKEVDISRGQMRKALESADAHNVTNIEVDKLNRTVKQLRSENAVLKEKTKAHETSTRRVEEAADEKIRKQKQEIHLLRQKLKILGKQQISHSRANDIEDSLIVVD